MDGSSFKELEGEQLVGSPADSHQLEAQQHCQIQSPGTDLNASKIRCLPPALTHGVGFEVPVSLTMQMELFFPNQEV